MTGLHRVSQASGLAGFWQQQQQGAEDRFAQGASHSRPKAGAESASGRDFASVLARFTAR